MLVITGGFVFLHIPKTGGTYIQTVLGEHLPVAEHHPYTHAPYDELPQQWRHLPVTCVVRNPWDWYVSWYHYEIQRGKPQSHWEGPASFAEATERACRGEIDHHLAPMIKQESIDLYSAYVKTIAGSALGRPDFTALRFERLQRQLLRFLRRHSQLPPPLERSIRRTPPIRASERGPYGDYYDRELAALVADRARWVCERFGYRFGGGRR